MSFEFAKHFFRTKIFIKVEGVPFDNIKKIPKKAHSAENVNVLRMFLLFTPLSQKTYGGPLCSQNASGTKKALKIEGGHFDWENCEEK